MLLKALTHNKDDAQILRLTINVFFSYDYKSIKNSNDI